VLRDGIDCCESAGPPVIITLICKSCESISRRGKPPKEAILGLKFSLTEDLHGGRQTGSYPQTSFEEVGRIGTGSRLMESERHPVTFLQKLLARRFLTFTSPDHVYHAA